MSHNPSHQRAHARKYQVAATAAVNGEATAHGAFLYFLTTINDHVHPATDEVSANGMRASLYRHFVTRDQRRQMSALYHSMEVRGILTRIGEEESTDHAGGNAAKQAGIFLVDRHRLMAAIANPAGKAPRTPRATTDHEIATAARKEYAAIHAAHGPVPVPVYASAASAAPLKPEGAALVGTWTGSSANVLGDAAADALF